MELLDRSAIEIAAAIREGTVSPLEVVDQHIARIEQVDPLLNAVVAERFDAARDEARQAGDRLVALQRHDEPIPPLLGVPCTVKEFFAMKGFTHTGGVVRNRHVVATEDATTVRRLREAGAIVLARTNVPEGGLWSEANNRLYGRTNNPWDLRCTSGGSSGGEGALIASGAVPFGLGSDLGGSIRLPAFFCGIAGHKPTGWMVPNTGHFAASPAPAQRMNSYGPMARWVADLGPLLRLIAGPDGHDQHVRGWPLGDPDRVEPGKLRVFVVQAPKPKLRPGVRAARDRAAAALAARGARVEPWSSPALSRVFEMWAAILATESNGASYRQILGGGRPIGLRWQLLKYPLGRSRHISAALAMMLLESVVGRLPNGFHARFVHEAQGLQAELEGLLGTDGVLLHAPYPTTAPRHHRMLLRPFDFVTTALFNVLTFPATAVPVGFDDHGLPVGVQIAAGRGHDHLCLAAARAVEQDAGGWVRAEPAQAPGAPALA